MTNAERRWLAAIVLVGVAIRLLAVAALEIAPDSDYLDYQTMALNLVGGRGLVDSFDNSAFFSAGYPLLVLAPVFALFGPNLFAAQAANAGLGTITMVCCYGVARASGGGPVARLSAAGFFALYIPSVVYAEYLAKENLMTPLLLGVIWCGLHAQRRPTAPPAAVGGLLIGLLLLTGSAALSLVPVAGLGLVFSDATPRRKLALTALAGAVAVAIVAPWLLRNLRVLGAPVLNTNGGFNLYLGNNPAADGFFLSIADTPRGPTWHALRERGEVAASATLQAEAIAWMTQHPGDTVRLALRKAVLFWTPPIHDGLGQPSTAERMMRRVWLVQFLLLVSGAWAGAWWWRRDRSVQLLGAAVLSYTAIHMVFYVIFRYREPIMPLLCVLTGFALQRIAARLPASARRDLR